MAAKIDIALGQRKFELIRDRIALILKEELSNQATIQADNTLNPDVYIERIIDFGISELPAVNVYLNRSTFDEGTGEPTVKPGSYNYYIDVHTSGKATDAKRGDEASGVHLHRLMGLIFAILENPHYIRLDFQPSFGITNRQITDTQIAEPKQTGDSYFLMAGRTILKVHVNEEVNEIEGDAGETGTYQFKIGETDKGYQVLEET